MNWKWLPNAITLIRIAAAPVVGWLVWKASTYGILSPTAPMALAAVLFTIACLTDWLDGFLARSLNATSEFGAKLDLWADKIIVALALLGLMFAAPIVSLVGLASLSVRDLYIMRLRANRPDVNLKATFLAKSKTAIVMAGMALAMFGIAYGAHPIFLLGAVLFALGCALSLYTGWQYIAAARAQPVSK